MKLFKRKKQKNNVGKIRRAKIKNIRKAQAKKTQSKKRSTRKRKKQPRKINWKKVGVLFLVICFAIFTMWVVLFSEVMKIEQIEIIGYDKSVEELTKEAEKLNERSFFNQTVDNNLVLFPTKEFISSAKKKYPVIRDIYIQKIFPNKLVINIITRRNVFLWVHKDDCQLFDEEADKIEEFKCENSKKILSKICNDKGELLKLDCQVIILENQEEIVMDKDIILSNTKLVQQILKELKTTFYFEDGLIVSIPNQVSREIKIRSDNHGEIWFSIDGDLKKQLEKFRALLEKKINLEDLENMLYVDLRLSDKIIYRFKEGYEDNEL